MLQYMDCGALLDKLIELNELEVCWMSIIHQPFQKWKLQPPLELNIFLGLPRKWADNKGAELILILKSHIKLHEIQ
jgi:hypothetical protein